MTIEGKDLKLIAVGDVFIEEPDPERTQLFDPISTISISESEYTIEGFTVDVNGGWGGIYVYGGPYYGIGEVDVTVKNNRITDYNRNGITVNEEKAIGKIMKNLVIGELRKWSRATRSRRTSGLVKVIGPLQRFLDMVSLGLGL